MNAHRKYIFCFFVIFCFLTQPFCFVEANQMDERGTSARNSPYRRAGLLCYAATYHGEMPNYFEQHINHWRLMEPSIRDSELEEGLNEWRSIERNSFKSGFMDFFPDGKPEFSLNDWSGRDLDRTAPLANTNDVSNLISSNGFENAIRRCAEEKGLVFDDLFENMGSTILRMDRHNNYFSRAIQILLAEGIAYLAFTRTISGLGRANQALGRRFPFYQRNRRNILVSGIGTVISATTIGDATPSEEEDNLDLGEEIERLAEQDKEEFKNNVVERSDPVVVLWNKRWINSESQRAIYRDMIRTFQGLDLDIDDLDGETILPHRELAILWDIYFVDYWFVISKLEEALKGEYHPDTIDLELIKNLFDLKKTALENQTDNLPERDVALELLYLTEDDQPFLCAFGSIKDDKDVGIDIFLENIRSRSDLLCRMHVFYTMRKHNGRLSPRRAEILQQMEAMLESL